jgi:hypothetical protein
MTTDTITTMEGVDQIAKFVIEKGGLAKESEIGRRLR